ncbi:MAG: hypothetical protein ACKV19_04900 [Verrucomicrobiales bacterium]
MTLAGLPANEIIQQGLEDLAQGRASVAAYLVKIASRRMQRCGIEVPVTDDEALNADHELYAVLGREYGDEAHNRYNALLRELVSFERALEARHRRMR